MMVNPYEADASKIPAEDRYIQEPLFGRYLVRSDDFVPAAKHILSETPESLEYWAGVLQRCDASTRVYENDDGGRDVFALGTVIIKSSHLKAETSARDYSLADLDEVRSIQLARDILHPVKVPQIYFAGAIDGRPVLVQERIPGVCLCVAEQYLSSAQMDCFKQQARELLRRMYTVKPPRGEYGYVQPDSDPVLHRGIQPEEREILFDSPRDNGVGLMHNDLTTSNIICDAGRIVAVVDWEMAGYFSWDAAAKTHRVIRSPQPEFYKHLNLPKETLDHIFFWCDLYDCGPVDA